MRALHGVMVASMLLSVAVQYNDPDPLPWVAWYGAAAGVGVLALRRPVDRRLPLLVAATGALSAIRIALHTQLDVPLFTALADWHMHSGGSEEAREIGGLMFASLWMAALARWPSSASPPA